MSDQEKKGSLQVVKKILKGAQDSVQVRVAKATPVVVKTLDRSMTMTANALYDGFAVIEKEGAKDQMELLKGYRWFLEKQMDAVDERITKLRKKAEQAAAPSQPN